MSEDAGKCNRSQGGEKQGVVWTKGGVAGAGILTL